MYDENALTSKVLDWYPGFAVIVLRTPSLLIETQPGLANEQRYPEHLQRPSLTPLDSTNWLRIAVSESWNSELEVAGPVMLEWVTVEATTETEVGPGPT